MQILFTILDQNRAFFKKLPVGGGGGVHKGPFGNDRRDQQIVGYADIVSIFIIE